MSGIGEEKTPMDSGDLDEVAAAWFHRLNDAAGGDRNAAKDAFQRWLDADPEHAEAFARTCAIWEAMGDYASEPEIVTLRQAALTDARSAAQKRWRPAHFARGGFSYAAAIYLVSLLALGVLGYLLLKPSPQVYTTGIGQRETITLADNSRVDIDADSRISVDYTQDRRVVHLIRGQAYFTVQRNPERPFVVESKGRRIIDIGTEFNVEVLDKGLRVTLVEGRVAVKFKPDADTTPHRMAELSAGDQLTAITGKRPRIRHDANVAAAREWPQGKLLFTNEPLSDAVARVMRYSNFQLTVDPSVADLRISGVFNEGDTAAFVDAVQTYYPVKAVSLGPNEMRLVRR